MIDRFEEDDEDVEFVNVCVRRTHRWSRRDMATSHPGSGAVLLRGVLVLLLPLTSTLRAVQITTQCARHQTKARTCCLGGSTLATKL